MGGQSEKQRCPQSLSHMGKQAPHPITIRSARRPAAGGCCLNSNTRAALRRARIATSVFFFVNGAVVGSWVPFIPERAHALGMSAGRVGAVLLGGGVGAVLMMPIAGILVPRLGSRRVSTVCGLGFALALALNVLAPTRWTLLCALVFYGLCGAGMDVSMNAQAVAVEARSEKRILSSLHGLFSLGNVVGSFGVSAAFARHAPPALLAESAAAVLVASVAFASRGMLPDDRQPDGKAQPSRSFAPQLLLLGSLIVAAMICEGGTADWSGLYLRNVRSLGPGWAGVGFGVFACIMLLGRLTGDLLVARFGEVRVLRLGGLFSAAGALTVVFGPGRQGALLGFALFGSGLANASPVLYRAAGRVPGVPAGVGLATAVGMGYAGLLAGPPALGGIAQAFGLPAIFLVMAVLCGLLSWNAPLARPTATPLAEEVAVS